MKSLKIFALLLTLVMALSLGLIGFVDDYIKVVKKQNLGLTIRQKTLMQLLVIIAFLGSLKLSGSSFMYIPFYGSTGDLGIFFFLFGKEFVVYVHVNHVAHTELC